MAALLASILLIFTACSQTKLEKGFRFSPALSGEQPGIWTAYKSDNTSFSKYKVYLDFYMGGGNIFISDTLDGFVRLYFSNGYENLGQKLEDVPLSYILIKDILDFEDEKYRINYTHNIFGSIKAIDYNYCEKFQIPPELFSETRGVVRFWAIAFGKENGYYKRYSTNWIDLFYKTDADEVTLSIKEFK